MPEALTRRKAPVWCIIVIIVVVVVALALIIWNPFRPPGPPVVSIGDTYCNFDLHVWFEGKANDLHLDLCCLNPRDITWHFFKPGEEKFSAKRIVCGTRASWTFEPIGYCQRVHFGIGFKKNPCVRPYRLIWTYNGKPIARVPATWQTWETVRDTVVDIIWNPERDSLDTDSVRFDATGPIVIGRSWAFSDRVIELPQLTRESKELSTLKWQPEDSITLKAGEPAILKIGGASKHRANCAAVP